MLTGITYVLAALCTALNAFFYWNDPHYPPIKGDSALPSILGIGVIYGLFALLAGKQRGNPTGAAIVLIFCLCAMGFLLWGRGQQWRGSINDPDYYHKALRFEAIFGGIAQMVCLLLAFGGVLIAGWITSNRT